MGAENMIPRSKILKVPGKLRSVLGSELAKQASESSGLREIWKGRGESIVAHLPENYEGNFEESKTNNKSSKFDVTTAMSGRSTTAVSSLRSTGVLLIGDARSTLITGPSRANESHSAACS
jgi:hypothetical protein